jgi:ribosomal protein S18 acetylase RimI-like enzyme
VRLRPASPDDEHFLLSLYSKNRESEFADVGWEDGALRAFVDMQFRVRKRAWAMQYPEAEYFVIERDGIPVGSVTTWVGDHELTLLDIAVRDNERGKGIGRRVIEHLQQQAAAAGLPIVLHVDLINTRAMGLYEKMGFRKTGQNQIQHRMEWRAEWLDQLK